MSPASHTRPAASIWKRFWSPTSLLEVVPQNATAQEAEAILLRNDVWLKTYMDLYILRWGVLWACSIAATILAAGEGVSLVLFVIALLAAIGSAAGLAAMIWTYRRASNALDDRARRPGRRY